MSDRALTTIAAVALIIAFVMAAIFSEQMTHGWPLA